MRVALTTILIVGKSGAPTTGNRDYRWSSTPDAKTCQNLPSNLSKPVLKPVAARAYYQLVPRFVMALFPWDDIWIEICRHVHYEGLPPTVAELTRYVQEWCENQYGKQPGDSTLKPKLGKLYQVLRRDGH